LIKSKSAPTSITISQCGQKFCTFSFPDRQVRIFDFASARLYRTYDESIPTATEMQQAGTAVAHLDQSDFDRRVGVEKELDSSNIKPRVNVIFDESGHFILYGSLLGTKVVNTVTNKVVKLYGKDESFRPLHLTLYQGAPDKKGVVTVAMAASDNPLLQEAETRDAMLVTTALGKVRFYMFTNDGSYVTRFPFIALMLTLGLG
jgi:peptidylprolyl isomerase domain and WD repeat-containing protein 1